MTEPTPFFADEMQLVAWRDSHTNGPTVTFRLNSSEDLEAFRSITMAKDGKAGQRIAAVLVLIADDETPQEPVQASHRKLGPLALLAVKWCRDPGFRSWLFDGQDSNEDGASEELKRICGVGSRREIDLLPSAAMRFHKQIREPYSKFLEVKK